MLASITPLGERGRGSRWAVTVVAFAGAATVAGAALGALLGAVGRITLSGTVGAEGRLAALAVLLAGAVALDLGSRRVPGPRRQVNERWLDEYRGWVYGSGYGGQLGVGFTTVVMSAATYVAVAAAFLSGRAGEGALVMGCYGAIRGVTPLLGARVSTPIALLRLHHALGRWHAPVRLAGVTALLASLGVALVGVLA
jgi:hypothetical protein